MELEAGHVAQWLKEGEFPPSTQFLLDQLYEFTTSTEENAYVLEHFEPDVIKTLIAYHYLKRTLIYHTTEGEVDGLFMWYRCDEDWTWEDIVNWTPDSKTGNRYFLAFLWAKGPALRRMTLELINRQPEVIRGKLFGCRERHDGPQLIRYDQRLLVKILQSNERER